MNLAIENFKGKPPLSEYPWCSTIEKLLDWASNRNSDTRAFCFDVVMSLAYIDATSGIEAYIESCDNLPAPYNFHIGFINLCSPCYEKAQVWTYQKAAKPQSGAIGKLSSEVILKFIERLSNNLEKVVSIGGTDVADAILYHQEGLLVFGEVKSAPLITYPMVFYLQNIEIEKPHQKVILTTSQLKNASSALYMHNQQILPLGKVGTELWPFESAVEFIITRKNQEIVSSFVETWLEAKTAYQSRNKNNKMYYLANASGSPPAIAKTRDKWPNKESISDSKTSVGMDRTDDIKKGIYQVLKIASNYKEYQEVKTALISNLPAYRHGEEYISPFLKMLWGYEEDVENILGFNVLKKEKMRRFFDYIITIEEPILRDFEL